MDGMAEILTELTIKETSLLNAIYERYMDLVDLNGQHTYSLHYNGGSLTRTGIATRRSQNDFKNEILNETDVQISISTSPRKPVFTSICAVLSGKNLNTCGDCVDLENICRNLMELDISNNLFDDWNEIRKLLSSLKKLKFLNLTSNKLCNFNPLNKSCHKDNQEILEEDKLQATIDFFNTEWPINENQIHYENLKTLVLNECFIDLKIIECLLNRLSGISELHISRNAYKTINFSNQFRILTLKILYINNNLIDEWNDICKLAICFPNLEHLVLSENPIQTFDIDYEKDKEYFRNFQEELKNSNLFKNLRVINMNKIKIDQWSTLDKLKEFPNLMHIRIHEIPLLEKIKTDEERHAILVGHLEKNITHLNGSVIPGEFKDACERKYLRFFMDVEDKPNRYFELETKHGKVNRLADVNLDKGKTVYMKIKYNEKSVYQNVKIKQTVGELKKSLESFVGEPSIRFRIFYIDKEAESAFGHDELKLMKTSLMSLKLKDGDEFDICLKPVSPKKPIK
ncbi:unnamed protein product [Brachionus calyciflorus]|uniref:Tubulin-specific chaperone cofactor E-like protein n=1 Tax=Brachionus calyciflorus TaxID=104777 RepID=A0A813M4P6_9BILA|nr:unnamed protein product [Brachionus calyciflorus]